MGIDSLNISKSQSLERASRPWQDAPPSKSHGETNMSASSIVDNISALVEELGTEKTAMDDPGGQDGQSTHPIAKTDDPGEQAPSEGARSAENTKDIKKDIPQSEIGRASCRERV